MVSVKEKMMEVSSVFWSGLPCSLTWARKMCTFLQNSQQGHDFELHQADTVSEWTKHNFQKVESTAVAENKILICYSFQFYLKTLLCSVYSPLQMLFFCSWSCLQQTIMPWNRTIWQQTQQHCAFVHRLGSYYMNYTHKTAQYVDHIFHKLITVSLGILGTQPVLTTKWSKNC